MTGKTSNAPKAQEADLFCDQCGTSRHIKFYSLGIGKGHTKEVHCTKCGEEWEVSK